jgi:hypothetical protein
MFKFTRNHLFSLSFVAVFAFNPGACSRIGKGCGAANKADDLARYSKVATSDALIASREVAESGFYRAKIQQTAVDAGMDAEKANDLSKSTVVKTKTGQYEYNGNIYKNIESIALPLNEGKAFINEAAHYGEAIRFLLHGSHLLHHTETYSEKSEKDYRLIVLMPKDVQKVSELYRCSIDTAQRIMDMVYSNQNYSRIIRVKSLKEVSSQVQKSNDKHLEAVVLIPKDSDLHFNSPATVLKLVSSKPRIPILGYLFDQLALFQSAMSASQAENWDHFFSIFSKEYTHALKTIDGANYILCLQPSQNALVIFPSVYGYKRL